MKRVQTFPLSKFFFFLFVLKLTALQSGKKKKKTCQVLHEYIRGTYNPAV